MKHRLARNIYKDGASIGSEFKSALKEAIATYRPKNIIESGTYLGLGSTITILDALAENDLKQALFISIESNSNFVDKATENLKHHKAFGQLMIWCGLSIPQESLPKTVTYNNVPESIIVDHADPMEYIRETEDFAIEGLIGRALQLFSYAPDLVLLDSAGHLGTIEFNYLMSKNPSSFILALDDTLHFKHYKTVELIKSNPKFSVIKESEDKFGFGIYHYVA